MSVTSVVAEYLVTVYTMARDGRPVIAARLAERLGVSAPTVTQTLRRMAKGGFVRPGWRKNGVMLTEAGREIAVTTVRRHFLAERLLTDLLGLRWHEVHEEANRLEHVISPRIEERLLAVLGNPTTCPHGNPMPGAEAEVAGAKRLGELLVGQRAKVLRVVEEAEDDPRLMEFLEQHGLVPGSVISVSEVVPFNETLQVRCGGEEVAISFRVASLIRVEPLPLVAPASDLSREVPGEQVG